MPDLIASTRMPGRELFVTLKGFCLENTEAADWFPELKMSVDRIMQGRQIDQGKRIDAFPVRRPIVMTLGTILIIVLVLLLVGGFSGRIGGYGYGMGNMGNGGIGLVLLIILVLVLTHRI